MKLKLLLSATFLACALSLNAATNELTALLQRALFEEEANRNLVAAIQAYQSLVEQFDQDRALAATAVFRLGECYRKQGNTNAAAAQYERLIRDFSDQGPLVALSRQSLGRLTPVVQGGEGPTESTAVTEEMLRIQTLIRNSPDLINAPQQNGVTLLESAAGNGDLAVAKLLLANGAAVNGLARPGLTPLHYAAANGHKVVSDLLLSKGASVDATNANGVTPLQLAARKGFEAMARGLLKAGASVNAAPNREAIMDLLGVSFRLEAGQTPLHLAARSGYATLIDLLIASGANVNAEDGRGRTPLSYAVERQDENGIQTLLAAKADPNAGSAALPLQVAATFAGEAMLETLLNSGAKPDLSRPVTWPVIWNRRGNSVAVSDSQNPSVTPLLLAVVARKPASVTTLIKYKADPNGTLPGGTPLLMLTLSDAPTLKALLEGGANPNVKRGTDNSVLAEAILNQNSVVVELLLVHGAKTDTKTDQEGWTPLHMAVLVRAKENRMAELLLEAGADPNAKAGNGRTPLHMAVEQGQEDLVALLLDKKADPNALDSEGRTPLDLTKSGSSSPRPFIGGIGMIPGAIPGGVMPPVPQPGSTVQKLAELLRQRGALDEVPRLDQIQMRRPAVGYATPILFRRQEDRNQFTLLEILAMQFEFLARASFDSRTVCRPDQMNNNAFAYPDFANVKIRKPAADLKTWEEKPVNLSALLESGDCSIDVPVTWGEMIQLPELDHPLYISWAGFSRKQLENLKKCLTRSVRVSVKGEAKTLELGPDITLGPPDTHINSVQITKATPFWIKAVLKTSKLVLASSDLSRVKVARRMPATGQMQEWVIDCSPTSQAPDLWLKDGDLIEIPEKQ